MACSPLVDASSPPAQVLTTFNAMSADWTHSGRLKLGPIACSPLMQARACVRGREDSGWG